jgi:hypothetical protein
MESPDENIGNENDHDALMYSDILRSDELENVTYGALLRPKEDDKILVIGTVDAGTEVDESESELYTIKQLIPEVSEDDDMMAQTMINGYQLMSMDDIPLFPDIDYLKAAAIECGAIIFLAKYFK